MKKLILLTMLIGGSAYTMNQETPKQQFIRMQDALQIFHTPGEQAGAAISSSSQMVEQAEVASHSSSTLTEYQKKKLDLKRLRMAIEIKQGNDFAFHGICPECGIFSNRLAHPNVHPDDRQLLCIGKCGDEKEFHQYAYFHKLQQDANATIHRLKHLLNESE